MKVTQCTGEGMGSCKRCSDNGKWKMEYELDVLFIQD